MEKMILQESIAEGRGVHQEAIGEVAVVQCLNAFNLKANL